MGKSWLLAVVVLGFVPAWVLAAGRTVRQYAIGNSLTGLVHFNEYTDLAATRGTAKATIRVVKLPAPKPKAMPPESPGGWGQWRVGPAYFYPVTSIPR